MLFTHTKLRNSVTRADICYITGFKAFKIEVNINRSITGNSNGDCNAVKRMDGQKVVAR